jgi:CBS domain-containing protein
MSQAIASLPVSSLIGDELITVTAETTIDAVARLLQDAGISIVAVGDPTAVDGVVSERDVVRVVAQGLDPTTVTAGDIATRELVWCQQDSTVPAVANEMFDRYVRHVLVAGADGLAGIVSARDLLGVYASEDAPDWD